MNTVELILKKRRGGCLTREELHYLIDGYCNETIPDYQMSAWCMAVCFQGMTPEESRDLTEIMAASGEQADLSLIPGPKVDKHSTGGVGDKTSLVIGPLVAAAGVPVCKMSGRGLGHTGGTIDKMESIPGLRTDLSPERLMDQVRRIGLGIAGQTLGMVPADKRLYALRDVTGTVDSAPLIAASIMSKKLAGGADAIVLDVKVGDGAFLKTIDEARRLAQLMVEIGHGAGRKTLALLTTMDQPLGWAVGNALEIREAIDTLRGKGPTDLLQVSLALGGRMVYLAGIAQTPEAGEALLREKLEQGEGLRRLEMMIEAQGGDVQALHDTALLPQAAVRREVRSSVSGYVRAIRTEDVGRIAMRLGAGRMVKEDRIDPAVGLLLYKKIGDSVAVGDIIGEIHGENSAAVEQAAADLQASLTIQSEACAPLPIVIDEISH